MNDFWLKAWATLGMFAIFIVPLVRRRAKEGKCMPASSTRGRW